jgi:hypothetical protein
MFASAYMGRKRRATALQPLLLRGPKTVAKGRILVPRSESIRKIHSRPMYAEANMGHPSREEGFVLFRLAGYYLPSKGPPTVDDPVPLHPSAP